MAPLNGGQDSNSAVVELAGADDAKTDELVTRLAQEDILGQLLRKDGLAGKLGMESGRPQLDWGDGIEKALARPDLLAGIEEEAAALHAQLARQAVLPQQLTQNVLLR